MHKNKNIILVFFVCVFALALSGCTVSLKKKAPIDNQNNNKMQANENKERISEDLKDQSKIKKFADYEELKEFLENNQNNSSISLGYGGSAIKSMPARNDIAAQDGIEKFAKEVQSTGAVGIDEAGDFSKTNIQVEGVDEADILKTDGNYIYAVAKNSLFIVKAKPAESAEVISKIEFKDRPSDIYINGEYLAIFGYDQKIYERDFYKSFKRRNSFLFLKIFDITDPKNPKQVRDLDIEGNYNNSRMIGDYLYLITNNFNYYYLPTEPVVPRIIDGGKVLPEVCSGDSKCFAPDVFYFDIPYNNYNLTTITAINIKNSAEQIKGDAYMMDGNQNMYVSQDNIYITYTKYVSEFDLAMEVAKEIIFPKLSAKDQERIRKIENAEEILLAKSEKLAKIAVIIERYRGSLNDDEARNIEEEIKIKMKEKYEDLSKELEKTVIHKIEINNGKLAYKAGGEVTGSVLNQFSMDESGNYFRIATTKNNTWSQFLDESNRESYNNLYILDENLKKVGSIERLAEGERIYSVRFMQDRAYMVTFKQTDPLFVIDLSVPADPKVIGKLKIPGFSNYLHPYDNATLIGIGKETEENESGGVITKGLKISLFDVSDISNPKEVGKYELGGRGSDSIALYDHKAFLFSKEKNLLVIPVSLNEEKGLNQWGKLDFSGAAVFNISKDGIQLKGKIDHSDGGKSADQDFWDGYNYYDNTVKRSLYIDDVLYTFSNFYLKMNKISDLSLIGSMPMKKEKAGSEIDYNVIN